MRKAVLAGHQVLSPSAVQTRKCLFFFLNKLGICKKKEIAAAVNNSSDI